MIYIIVFDGAERFSSLGLKEMRKAGAGSCSSHVQPWLKLFESNASFQEQFMLVIESLVAFRQSAVSSRRSEGLPLTMVNMLAAASLTELCMVWYNLSGYTAQA